MRGESAKRAAPVHPDPKRLRSPPGRHPAVRLLRSVEAVSNGERTARSDPWPGLQYCPLSRGIGVQNCAHPLVPYLEWEARIWFRKSM